MTHDELLKKIDRRSVGASLLDSLAWKSLRAVVELHKPATFIGEIPLPKELSTVLCDYCFRLGYNVKYPCENIWVIEKELG